MLKCVVVGDRRHIGHIRTEGYRRQGSPLDVKFIDQLGGEVGGLGRGTAVTEEQNFVSLADGPFDDLYRPVDQRMTVKFFEQFDFQLIYFWVCVSFLYAFVIYLSASLFFEISRKAKVLFFSLSIVN